MTMSDFVANSNNLFISTLSFTTAQMYGIVGDTCLIGPELVPYSPPLLGTMEAGRDYCTLPQDTCELGEEIRLSL